MKKRIFSSLLVIFAFVLALSVVADDDAPESNGTPDSIVKVGASMQVCKDGDDLTNAGSTLTLTDEETSGFVDYRTVLDTTIIKNTIIEWYEYGEYLIEQIAGNNEILKATLRKHFEEWPVTGEFVVTIEYPAQMTVDQAYLADSRGLFGFNPKTSDLFEETGRTVTTAGDYTTEVITIAIKDVENDGVPGIMEQHLYDGVKNGTYLNELVYVVENVTPNAFTDKLVVKGRMDGYTAFQIGQTFDPSSDRVVFYTDLVEATLYKHSSTPTPSIPEIYKITFNIDGNTDEVPPMNARGHVSITKLPIPEKPGYTFDGWYYDSELTNKVTTDLNVHNDITLYGHWSHDSLNDDEHFAYIIGYPDGTVRPLRNITREEATMMFYRLLRDDVRDAIFMTSNDFDDINSDRWSNNAISTMAGSGYVLGRSADTFDPETPITRAEFATLAVRFATLEESDETVFSDISGHWAESYILKAAKAGWINGYPDGTFKPDAYITRAEAMTLVNNVLVRHVEESGLHADTRKWIDMDGSEWYYYIVLEATNSHDFTRKADGYNEKWTAILPNKTWK